MNIMQRKLDGTLWRAGNTIYGLCASYNHATDPGRLESEYEHGKDFTERDSGIYWPLNRNRLTK